MKSNGIIAQEAVGFNPDWPAGAFRNNETHKKLLIT